MKTITQADQVNADEALKNSLKWLSSTQMWTIMWWRIFKVHKVEYYILLLFKGYAVPIAFKRAATVNRKDAMKEIANESTTESK